MRYVTGIDEAGNPIDVKDPHATRLRQIADAAARNAEALAKGLLAVQEVFGTDLPNNPAFTGPVVNHLKSLLEKGAKATAASSRLTSGRELVPASWADVESHAATTEETRTAENHAACCRAHRARR